ncbi:MAG: UDP-N-acetylmuramoyl-L-alanine--D-glutamate ligase [Elusimicrobia bacterium]|nr:UDP-N-acetylmuramoyl-L-alanine--D-glutamate ligase [Elusimicrobiota bacterium]
MSHGFEPAAFKKSRACVLGLGKSGLAAASLLLREGFSVFGSDTRPAAQIKSGPALPAGLKWEGSGHGDRVLKCGFVVKSPGIPHSAQVIRRLEAAGIPVFSEVEVALAFCRAKTLVAITGTNGKTTTAALTAAIFARGLPGARGGKTHLCGNVGIPVSQVAGRARAKDALVMEVSSYQLEDSRRFAPRAAAILNITADHLDHHGAMAGYIEAKARVFREQGPQDWCVFNAFDPLTLKLSRRCPSRRLYFGPKGLNTHAWVDGSAIEAKLPDRPAASFPLPPLPGEHNQHNAMAAVLLGLSLGVRPAAIRSALRSFKGVEHRLEECGTMGGMRCINDSKATNVDSTLVALRSMPEGGAGGAGKVLLILGGLHKGSPYTPLKSLIARRVKCILTIGSAAAKVEEDLAGTVHIFPCGDLAVAVDTALKVGERGDILLLSPACASFDQFKDFEDRGDQFKELIKKRHQPPTTRPPWGGE